MQLGFIRTRHHGAPYGHPIKAEHQRRVHHRHAAPGHRGQQRDRGCPSATSVAQTPTSSSSWSLTHPTSARCCSTTVASPPASPRARPSSTSFHRPSRPSSSRARSTRRAATTPTPRLRRRSAPRRPARPSGRRPQAAFDRVKPLFELMGKNITSWAATETDRPPRSPTRSSWRSTCAAVGEALSKSREQGRGRPGPNADHRRWAGLAGQPHPGGARRGAGLAAADAGGSECRLHQVTPPGAQQGARRWAWRCRRRPGAGSWDTGLRGQRYPGPGPPAPRGARARADGPPHGVPDA